MVVLTELLKFHTLLHLGTVFHKIICFLFFIRVLSREKSFHKFGCSHLELFKPVDGHVFSIDSLLFPFCFFLFLFDIFGHYNGYILYEFSVVSIKISFLLIKQISLLMCDGGWCGIVKRDGMWWLTWESFRNSGDRIKN